MNETKQEMNKIQEIKKVNKDSFKKDLIFLLLKILLIICVMFLIFSFVYGIARTNDISMKPAIKEFYTIDLIKTLFLEMWSFLKRMIE